MSELLFPRHDGGLQIFHNAHKTNYEPVKMWMADDDADWRSEEDKAEAIRTDSVWTMIWWPITPVGSHYIAAPTFVALLEFATEVEREAEGK